MERPTKRPRLSFTPGSPEEVPEEWDLNTARAQNDLRLKSIFEGIFTKYGKDFTEVGDEIDLETGKIVVDNGHLLGMREEKDTGDKAAWVYGDGADSESENQETAEDANEPAHEVNGEAEQNEQEWSDVESDDSILGSALVHSPKPEARQSDLDHVDKDSGPKDALWRAPEIPRMFSTPTAESKDVKAAFSPQLPALTREPSPPGSGSLWTIPRRGRPRTEGKPRTTPNKRRPRAKLKCRSSPVVHDWSFAETPDGDESDDPLQESQPSPTPSRLTSIRGRSRKCPPLSLDNGLKPARQSSPQEPMSQGGSATTSERGSGAPDDSQNHLAEQDDTQEQVAGNATRPQKNPSAKPHSLGARKPQSQNTTSKIYSGITPDEAKLIVRMRYAQNKSWKEVQDALPGRQMSQILAFNYHHWTIRRENPPRLSAPWSQNELETLENLKDQSGLSWPDIRTRFTGRSRAEVEFELLRLWVGDEVWFGEEREEGDGERGPSAQDEGTENGEKRESESPERPGPIQRPFASAPELGPSTPGKRSRPFEEFLEDDDSDTAFSEASSPSKLSAIQLDSPAPSRQGSRTPGRASPAKRVKLTY